MFVRADFKLKLSTITTEHGGNNRFLFLLTYWNSLKFKCKKKKKNRIQTLLLLIFRLPLIVDFLSLPHSLPASVARVLTVLLHPLLVVVTLSNRCPLCAVVEIRLILTSSCKLLFVLFKLANLNFLDFMTFFFNFW